MSGPVELLLGAVAAFVVALGHARIFPMKVCPRCGGSRRRPGGGTTFAVCGRCGGSGEVRRWLAGKGN